MQKPNRKQRRFAAVVQERIARRPGTGYTKRSAAKAKPRSMSVQKAVILAMKDNEQVIDKVSTGALDAYL